MEKVAILSLLMAGVTVALGLVTIYITKKQSRLVTKVVRRQAQDGKLSAGMVTLSKSELIGGDSFGETGLGSLKASQSELVGASTK
jgi:hypothetical protein